jgi:hypothetical protein
VSPSFQYFTSIINNNLERKVRWQTGNGANFSLFWERDAKGILPKKAEVIISGALFLWFVSFWTNKKK